MLTIPTPPPYVYQQIAPEHQIEYIERAERGMKSEDENVKKCVENLKKDGGYGGLGDYASYEYCQWWAEK